MAGSEPVILAFKTFEPKYGVDENLSPVIFLHGLSTTHKHWDDIPQNVADKTKRMVYAIDARNHGDSPYSDYFSISLNVEDLFHFMDNRNISKAVLVGHSMGGRTAIYAALSKPERVEKIFVEDMHLKKAPKAAMDAALKIIQIRRESTLHIPRGLSESEARKFSDDFMLKKFQEMPLQGKAADLRNARVDLKRKSDGSFDLDFNVDAILRNYFNDIFYSEPKGQYEGPAYFMYGPASPLAVQNEEETIRKHFPNAELVEFPGAGHVIHTFFNAEFTEKIVNNL